MQKNTMISIFVCVMLIAVPVVIRNGKGIMNNCKLIVVKLWIK